MIMGALRGRILPTTSPPESGLQSALEARAGDEVAGYARASGELPVDDETLALAEVEPRPGGNHLGTKMTRRFRDFWRASLIDQSTMTAGRRRRPDVAGARACLPRSGGGPPSADDETQRTRRLASGRGYLTDAPRFGRLAREASGARPDMRAAYGLGGRGGRREVGAGQRGWSRGVRRGASCPPARFRTIPAAPGPAQASPGSARPERPATLSGPLGFDLTARTTAWDSVTRPRRRRPVVPTPCTGAPTLLDERHARWRASGRPGDIIVGPWAPARRRAAHRGA
jgi:hypothetical protein